MHFVICAVVQRAMSWVLESTGDATCMNDYVSMNAPVVELLTKDDLALALRFLNPTLSDAETKALYKRGEHCTRRVLASQHEEACGGRDRGGTIGPERFCDRRYGYIGNDFDLCFGYDALGGGSGWSYYTRNASVGLQLLN